MVPWPSKELSADIFGNEIELIPLDINAPGKGEEAYSPYSWLQKPTSASLYDASISGQPGLLEMIREFTRRAQQVIAERDLSFDVIHAHDLGELRRRRGNRPGPAEAVGGAFPFHRG